MSWPKKTSMLASINKVPGMPTHAKLAMASGRMPHTDLEGNVTKPPREPGARGGMMARMRAKKSIKSGMKGTPYQTGGGSGGQPSYAE